MSDRCSIFCKNGEACISDILEQNHRRCITDIVINRTHVISGTIDLLLLEKRDCLGKDVIELLTMIQKDITALSQFIESLSEVNYARRT